MKNLIFTFVAFLRAAADFIQENSGSAEAAATPSGEGVPAEPEKPKKQGRPRKVETAPTPTPEPEPAEEVKTYTVEELKAICDPLIKAGGGEAEFLREMIKANGGTAISKIPTENHAAFVADVTPRAEVQRELQKKQKASGEEFE